MTCNALSQQFLGIVRIIVINSIITLHDSMRAENKASLMPFYAFFSIEVVW